MIRIVGNASALAADDVVGKIVFKENAFNWPGFGSPRLATSVSKSRVNLARLGTRWDAELGQHVIVGMGDGESDGYMSIGSVACICDSLTEANHVLAVTRQNHRDLNEYERQAKERLGRLHGVTEDDLLPAGGPRP